MRESILRPERLRQRGIPLRSRLWREWCFLRVVLRHFRLRFLLMVLILVGGGAAFTWFEPEKRHSLPQAVYFSWSLVFGEAPEAFPPSPVLQALFFLVPILGLTVIIEGIVDLAFVLRDRRRWERGWCAMMAESLSGHVVLVGLGKLGFRTYTLLRELGETVVVIERDAENQFLEVVRRDGSSLLIGDARREALLRDANLRAAKSVVLATDDDLANLETALDARRLAPGIQVVLRMFDQNMADKIRDGFDIHIAMSQSALSAPAFATAAIDASIVNSFLVDQELVVIQRWMVRRGSSLEGRTVGGVLSDLGFSVVSRRAGAERPQMFPPPDTRLGEGDRLVVQGSFQAVKALRAKAADVAEPR